MKIKKIFKFFKNLRKPNLAKKISLYFIIFGIIVAYLSFLVFSIGSGRSLVKNMERIISIEFIKAHTGKYPPRKIRTLKGFFREHRLGRKSGKIERDNKKEISDPASADITYKVNDKKRI